MVDWSLNPTSSFSNAEDVEVGAWRVYDDQGSGELERGGAKGSSNGFSSNAREDCCKRSSKPDMTASLWSQSLRQATLLVHSPTTIFPIDRLTLTFVLVAAQENYKFS